MPKANTIKLALISMFLVVGLAALLLPPRHSMESLLARIDKDFPRVEQISTEELARRLASGNKVQLFDVRTVEEYQSGHLPNAKLLEPGTPPKLAMAQFAAGEPNPVVLYCSVGYRAAEMGEEIRLAGWTNLVVLRGSIFQWARENRELTSTNAGPALVHPHSITYTHLVPAGKRLELPGSTLLLNHLPRGERFRLALGIGLLVVFLIWESFAPAYRWFSNSSARLQHGWRNYVLSFINVILAGVLFVQLWLFAAKWAQQQQFGLLNVLNVSDTARLVIAIILLDLWTYTWHWLNHHISFLWRFHRTHHSELAMDVTSAVRFHFGEIVLSGLLRVPIILLLGVSFKELLVYEIVLFASVQFHHANIRLPEKLDRLLSFFIASPGYHRVHHSADPVEANRNYSSLLTFWDRLFRTRSDLFLNSSKPAAGFGVAGMNRPEHHTIVALVESPLE
jgi:sterol desaturase/sphingolipid hydroxylase (fatty acid hydroxylase superfamily)/rhodanese-related sulfurtransferase